MEEPPPAKRVKSEHDTANNFAGVVVDEYEKALKNEEVQPSICPSAQPNSQREEAEDGVDETTTDESLREKYQRFKRQSRGKPKKVPDELLLYTPILLPQVRRTPSWEIYTGHLQHAIVERLIAAGHSVDEMSLRVAGFMIFMHELKPHEKQYYDELEKMTAEQEIKKCRLVKEYFEHVEE